MFFLVCTKSVGANHVSFNNMNNFTIYFHYEIFGAASEYDSSLVTKVRKYLGQKRAQILNFSLLILQ